MPIAASTSGSLSRSATPTWTAPLTTGVNVHPGEKPPVIPPGFHERTATGAYSSALFYYQAYDWGLATVDPALLTAVSAPQCNACARIIDALRTARADGHLIVGERVAIGSARVVQGTFKVPSDYVVLVHTTQSAGQVLDSAGSVLYLDPSSSTDSLVFLSWFNGRWQVVEVGAPS